MNAERLDIHSMTPQQKADYTYDKVRQVHFNKVLEAEQLRTRMESSKLSALLHKFASEHIQQKLEQGLIRREGWTEKTSVGRIAVDVSNGRRIIDLAMAGLFRIGHVDSNSQASRTVGGESKAHLQKAKYWYRRHESPLSVKRTTNHVFETIHGGAIYWPGEAIQDYLKTLSLDGDLQQLHRVANRVITDTFFGSVDSMTSRDLLNDEEKLRKISAGIESAMGMAFIQLSRADKNRDGLRAGFNFIKSADKLEHNAHRLATVSLWTLWGSIAYSQTSLKQDFVDEISDRVELGFDGAKTFGSVLFSKDYKQAISAANQFVDGSKKLKGLARCGRIVFQRVAPKFQTA